MRRTDGVPVLPARLTVRHSIALCAGFAGILVLASVTLGTSALLAAPFAMATWPEQALPLRARLSAVALGVFCTGIAFAMFYRLIERIGANRAVPEEGIAMYGDSMRHVVTGLGIERMTPGSFDAALAGSKRCRQWARDASPSPRLTTKR